MSDLTDMGREQALRAEILRLSDELNEARAAIAKAMGDMLAEVARLTDEVQWPRCEDCGAELQEVHSELPRECPQCRLSARLHLADMKNATLTAETCDLTARVDLAQQSMGVAEADRDELRALLARVLDSHRQPWVYGMSVTITSGPVYVAWRADIEAALVPTSLED